MAQTVNMKVKGLYTAPNPFSGVPEGALVQADDVVINQENLVEPRRGFESLLYSLPSVSDRIVRFVVYQGYLIACYSNGVVAYYDAGAGGWQPYSGTYDNPDDTLARLRFQVINKNLYFSTDEGIKKLDAYNGTVAAAGVPKGLDLQLALSGSSGFFTNNEVTTETANTASGSPNLAQVSDISLLEEGQYVSGTGITAGTTISSITPSATVTQTTGNTAVGSTSLTNLPINTGLVAGQLITGTGIPPGTRVNSISGAGPYTVTMSQAATITATGTSVTFSSDPVVTLSANATANGTGVSLTFSSGSQVSYRIVFGIKDANNNVIYGAPSQIATLVNNTGGTRDVAATFTIPSGITTAHFFQIYRSAQTANDEVVPLDDMQQVYEGNPSSSDISNGYVTVTDSVPDSLRGQFLYTGTSQGGIGSALEPPPYCKDFCSFRGYAMYANVKLRQRLKLTILSVGSPNGIQVNDTIVIAGVTYTAKASETASSGEFAVVTSGTPAQNIADTANSLIKVINRYASNTAVYAYLISGPTDLPGQILLEARSSAASAFAATASAHGSAYSPTLPTSGTTVESAQDVYKNRMIIAPLNQPEGAPLQNLTAPIGSDSEEILRVIPLRDYVIILKTDGVFRLTGLTLTQFQIFPFDLTTRCLAPDSAVALSNEVWCVADQGIVSISDTGVNTRSRPIEDVITGLFGVALAEVTELASAVAYETDRKYVLGLPGTAGDTANQQAYVFNTFTNTWTRWTRKFTAGFIHPTENKLYLGNSDDSEIAVERKTGTYADYVDEGFDTTIVSASGYEVVLDSILGITEGDLLYLDSTHRSVISDVDADTNTVTVEDSLTWTPGAATIYPAIESIVQWEPASAGNPGHTRQCSEGIFIFKATRFYFGVASFYSDISQSFEDVPLTGFSLGTWGGQAWGSVPWGGVNRPRNIRFYVPQNKQYCSQLNTRLTIRNAYSAWKLEGLSLTFYDISEEVASA